VCPSVNLLTLLKLTNDCSAETTCFIAADAELTFWAKHCLVGNRV
jgi:hypothetical protein